MLATKLKKLKLEKALLENIAFEILHVSCTNSDVDLSRVYRIRS